MKDGDLDTAKTDLCKSISLDPSRAVAWGDLGEVFARKDEQEKAVSCFLIAYQISGKDYIKYLKSLQNDPNPQVQAAGFAALRRIGAVPDVPTDQNE